MAPTVQVLSAFCARPGRPPISRTVGPDADRRIGLQHVCIRYTAVQTTVQYIGSAGPPAYTTAVPVAAGAPGPALRALTPQHRTAQASARRAPVRVKVKA